MANKYALERVIIAIIYHILSAEDIWNMGSYLLVYARKKGEYESFNYVLTSFREWCRANNNNERYDALFGA